MLATNNRHAGNVGKVPDKSNKTEQLQSNPTTVVKYLQGEEEKVALKGENRDATFVASKIILNLVKLLW